MALTIDALKGLFKKLGGSDSGFAGVKTIPEAIDKVTSVASSGGGGSLPTPGNVGNVLTSTGDGWESAAPSGDEFVVTASLSIETYQITNMSASFAEVKAAAEAKRPVRLSASAEGYGVFLDCYLGLCIDTFALFFGVSSVPDIGKVAVTVEYSSSGIAPTVYYHQYLPYATNADNGKILGVVNGVYELVEAKPLVVHGTISGSTATITDEITVAEIADVAAANRTVYFEAPDEDGNTARFILNGHAHTETAAAVTFNGLGLMDDEQNVTRLAGIFILIQTTAQQGTFGMVYKKIIENV